MDGIKTLTLSYTFFKTDHEDEDMRGCNSHNIGGSSCI